MSAGNGKNKRTMVRGFGMKVGVVVEDVEEGYGLSKKRKVCEQKTMHLYPELFKVLQYSI